MPTFPLRSDVSLPLTEEVRNQLYQHFLDLVEEIQVALTQHDQRHYDQLIECYNGCCDWFRDHGRRDPLLREDEHEIQDLIHDWREARSRAQFEADRRGTGSRVEVHFDYCCLQCSYRVKDMPRAVVYHLRIAHSVATDEATFVGSCLHGQL